MSPMRQLATAAVSKRPKCDTCDAAAMYDYRTAYGFWAYGCADCYRTLRLHDELGTGKGQFLVVKPS